MPKDIQRYTEYLVGLGTDGVEHSGEKGFLAHLIAVCRWLEEWGADEAVCLAGLFHSIYGTEKFQGFSLPLDRRHELVELIGERAERLAYLNSAMDRPAFDALLEEGTPRRLRDRFLGDTVELAPREARDLLQIQVSDWLEQVERLGEWDYRRAAYRRMAEQLGPRVVGEYEQVFAREGGS